MKLYYAPGTCALAPHILLREIGRPFDLEKVDLREHRTAGGEDYYGINPKGSVPLLVLDDGERLTEGPVICQYLGDQSGRTDLVPAAGTLARYRMMEWQNFITAELHKSYSPLFKRDADPAIKAYFRAALAGRYRHVAASLEGRSYLTGEDFTAADAYLFAVTRWAPAMEVDLTGLAPVQAFMQRVAARAAVRQAMEAEGLSGAKKS